MQDQDLVFNKLYRGNRICLSSCIVLIKFNCGPAIFYLPDNIRGILYHLKKERISSSEVHKHYAILPIKRNEEDEFNDSLLEAFGVTSIRIDTSQGFGNQIELILKQLYLSVDGIDEHNWNLVKKGGIREKRMVF